MHNELTQNIQIPWVGPSGSNGTTTLSGPSELTNGPLTQGGAITLGSVLSKALPIVFIFAGFGLFLTLILGGFTFLTSGGDTKKMEQGRQQITNALIGFIIIFCAFWLVQALGIMSGIGFKNFF